MSLPQQQPAAHYKVAVMPPGALVPLVDDAPVMTQPYPGFLLVRTHAASINPVDKYDPLRSALESSSDTI